MQQTQGEGQRKMESLKEREGERERASDPGRERAGERGRQNTCHRWALPAP